VHSVQTTVRSEANMLMYKTAVVGFCLILCVCAEEVRGETKNPCDAGEGHDCESTHGVSALQMTLSSKKGENLPEESDEDDSRTNHIQSHVASGHAERSKEEKGSNEAVLYENLIGDGVLPGETKMGPHFHALEQWQDLTKYELFDADAIAKGTLTVSQQEWLQAFSKLDVNKDGTIDANDLEDKETQFANHHLNATHEDFRQAVTIMTEIAPEFADFITVHEPAMVFLAETNKSAPEDAPVPSQEAMELFQNNEKNSKTIALTEWTACPTALVTFVYGAVEWGLNMMNIYVLGKFDGGEGLKFFDRVKAEYKAFFIERAQLVWKSIKQFHLLTAAKAVWDTMKQIFSLGIMKSLIRAALSKMSWWEWATTGIGLMARMVAQMATAGAALIAKMAYQIVNAIILVQKGKEVCLQCSLNCGFGDTKKGEIAWAEHPSKCMDVAGGKTNLQMWDCDDATEDNIRFIVPTEGSGQIRRASDISKCLDVASGGTENGNNIVIWECVDGNQNQQFTVPHSGTGNILWTLHPNKCLDVSGGGTDNGVNVQLWDCNKEEPKQQWKLP